MVRVRARVSVMAIVGPLALAALGGDEPSMA